MSNRRVVVTGLGCVSPCGNDVNETWTNVKNGVSGIDKITLFDSMPYTVHIAGEVKNFSLEKYEIDRKVLRKMNRATKFLLGASIEAVNDAGYTKDTLKNEKCGIITGVGIGLNEVLEESYSKYYDEKFGVARIPPMTAPMSLNNEAPANVAIYFQIHGPAWALSTACASGTDAIGLASDMIKSGRCDVCMASGCDATITGFNISSYSILQALCQNGNENPKAACKPFDKNRSGFIMSEGAAVLFLEDYEHAKARGAKIYAEIAGYGTSTDAYHITAPCEDGAWGAAALKDAISEAGLKPEDIQYYNAHGTSTSANDTSETKMLKSVFGDYAYKLHVSSTKSETGHMIGAAGAIEALFCVKSIEDGFIPPTINLSEPDLEHGCDLDYTPNKGVACQVDVAASVSLGFGGHNGAVIIKKI